MLSSGGAAAADPDLRFRLGASALESGMARLGERHLRQAALGRDRDAFVCLYLSAALERLGKAEAVRSWFRRAVAVDWAVTRVVKSS